VQPQLHPKSKEAKMQFHFLTREQTQQLIENGRANAGREHRKDFKPAVKLYCPWNLAVWYLTEIDPDDYGTAYGLFDLGEGFAEIGSVNLIELANREGPEGLRIERDVDFRPDKTLSAYAREARATHRDRRRP
jgi:hypothetical protein